MIHTTDRDSTSVYRRRDFLDKTSVLRKGVEEPLNLNEQNIIDLMMGELRVEVKRKKGWNVWYKSGQSR